LAPGPDHHQQKNHLQAHFCRIYEQAPLIWVIFTAKNFHNGTNIIAEHDTLFLGEEILEFFMASTVKTHLSVLTQKIPAL
jgi:hypothetical protein